MCMRPELQASAPQKLNSQKLLTLWSTPILGVGDSRAPEHQALRLPRAQSPSIPRRGGQGEALGRCWPLSASSLSHAGLPRPGLAASGQEVAAGSPCGPRCDCAGCSFKMTGAAQHCPLQQKQMRVSLGLPWGRGHTSGKAMGPCAGRCAEPKPFRTTAQVSPGCSQEGMKPHPR